MSESRRLQFVWALVLSGLIFYIPANTIPVMTITITGDVQNLTILGGVQELAACGLPQVAVLIFAASILIPFLKLATLCWVLFLHDTDVFVRQRDTALKILHQIGSWSMVDVFLLSVLAAVGQLGILAQVVPRPGVLFFVAVLLSTLFAADLYKPSMIWKTCAAKL